MSDAESAISITYPFTWTVAETSFPSCFGSGACITAGTSTKFVESDDDITSNIIVPFQVAYAVSIHKAQGLEYNSVKVVITNEVDENISHSIFYTAITRARKHLKIYWSPEVQEKILTTIQPRNDNKDVALLKRTVLD